MKSLLSTAAVLVVAFAFSGPVAAGDKGQKIGQNPELLAATKCANAGKGNLGEIVEDGECSKNRPFSGNADPKLGENDVKDQDPGNSGDNNAVQQ